MRQTLLLLSLGILLFTSCQKSETIDNPLSGRPGNGNGGGGSSMPSVRIGKQIWTLKNLDVTTYRNGDEIPQVTDPAEWTNLTTGAWCWYNNDSATYGSVYGRLYNWYAVNDPRGLAPKGWHVPTSAEWNIMANYLDASVDTTGRGWFGTTIASQLKNSTGWDSLGNGTNSSGFAGLPGGVRNIKLNQNNADSIYYYSVFEYAGTLGGFWTSTETSNFASDPISRSRSLSYRRIGLGLNITYKQSGMSVRCVKNQDNL